jgi:hypothetical protein
MHNHIIAQPEGSKTRSRIMVVHDKAAEAKAVMGIAKGHCLEAAGLSGQIIPADSGLMSMV